MSFRAIWCLGLAACGGLLASARADEPVDYARQIKPLFTKHCAACHGPEKQKSGLRLDSAVELAKGGDSGPAVVAGRSGESLLVQALLGVEGAALMPPKGRPRPSPEEIALVKTWIDQGAMAPVEETPAAAVVKRSTHWAFQPIVRPPVPAVGHQQWVKNPIDAFILARLELTGLEPAPEADRTTLIRRLSFDLLGLPPSVAEVDEFVGDSRPDAYERLVERLLQSPHYGERWGRHWLDLARYADSNGFTRDFPRLIWKYRDWVIEALNRDLPFDEFTIEQLAGDMLPNASPGQITATGFHRNTLINEEGGADPEQFRVEAVVDRINTTGVVFLGLTVGCAQCHDHKYDPISQREFYQLFAFLNNADEPTLELPTPEQLEHGEPQRRDELRRQIAELDREFRDQKEAFQAALERWERELTAEEKAKLPFDVINALNFSPEMRSDADRATLARAYKASDSGRREFPVLGQIAALRKTEPHFLTTMILRERAEPRATYIHLRGDFLRKGARVAPAVPAVLPPLPVSGRPPNRLDFARWLVDPENPLTPRVTVNRVWQKYFGRGIVETENDFGAQGAPPTHPELLDWLAREFIAPTLGPPGELPSAWRLKALHKLIVTSATYRQSSRFRPDLVEVDPQNRLLARQVRLRFDAEIIRDAALAASGLLNRTLGGPSVNPPQPAGVFDFTQDKKEWKTATGPDRYRRGLYTYLWRSSPYPAMTVFDFPDANTTCTRRVRSNTPLQSLTLANDQAFVELAQGLAARVLKTPAASDAAGDATRIREAFRLCLSREPLPGEQQRLAELLARQRSEFAAAPDDAQQLAGPLAGEAVAPPEAAAWTALARVLINLDEFITRE